MEYLYWDTLRSGVSSKVHINDRGGYATAFTETFTLTLPAVPAGALAVDVTGIDRKNLTRFIPNSDCGSFLERSHFL